MSMEESCFYIKTHDLKVKVVGEGKKNSYTGKLNNRGISFPIVLWLLTKALSNCHEFLIFLYTMLYHHVHLHHSSCLPLHLLTIIHASSSRCSSCASTAQHMSTIPLPYVSLLVTMRMPHASLVYILGLSVFTVVNLWRMNFTLNEEHRVRWNIQIDTNQGNKTYTWRDRPEDPDTSEEEELTSNYETVTEPEKERIMIITMAGSSSKEETFSKETKKKLKTPTPYSGKREDLWKLLQEIKIYFLGNEGLYSSDSDKILFVLSYMSDEMRMHGKRNTSKLPNKQLLKTTLSNLFLEITAHLSKDWQTISHPTMRQKIQSTIWRRCRWTTLQLKNMLRNSKCL